ncbi:MAG TPA: GAF domain-containing protein, partial [Candidatus Polarisedimenticolia bacterium]|nr:GAF domain-containing protein [Candidatus Polarisedimenticolia bacterium]
MNRNLDSLSAPAVSELADAPRQLEHFRTVYELTDSVLRARGPEEIYQAALHGLERAVGTKRSAILLYDSDDVMRFKAWHDLSDGYRAAVEGHSPWPRDAMDPQPVLVPDVKLDAGLTSYLDLFRSEGIGALAFIPLLARGRLIGKFMLYFADAHPFTEDEVRLAGVIAGHVALAVERKRVEGALEYLAGASAVLDCSLDFDATLAEVARRMVPYVADWVLVETLDDAAHLEPAAGVHADPLLADALTRLIALRGSVDGSSSLALQAIRTGRTTLEMNAREALVSEFGGQGPSGELLQGLGCRSAIAMALRARGRVLGSITLVSKNRVLDVRDVALAEDLARRGAVALDNARLYREAQAAFEAQDQAVALLDTLLEKAPIGLAFFDRELR